MTSALATALATAPITPHAQSFEQVYATLQPAVLRLARRQLILSGSAARAGVYGVGGVSPEDIAQQTWLKVWQHWPDLAGRSAPARAAYVLRTTKHLVIDHQRQRAMRGRVGEVALTADRWEIVNDTTASRARETQPEAAALDAAVREETHALLGQLDADCGVGRRYSAHLLDALLIGESPTETARRLGVTYGVVKTGQWRIRRALRQHAAASTASEVA